MYKKHIGGDDLVLSRVIRPFLALELALSVAAGVRYVNLARRAG